MFWNIANPKRKWKEEGFLRSELVHLIGFGEFKCFQHWTEFSNKERFLRIKIKITEKLIANLMNKYICCVACKCLHYFNQL